jgi:hypothetical protein
MYNEGYVPDAYDLYQKGLKQLLTVDELKIVMQYGYMCTHRGPYDDDARHYEFQTMLEFQQLLLMHKNVHN